MKKIIYLNKDDILESHKIGMTEFGGKLEGRSLSCIEKRVVEPQTEYFGEEQYPGFLGKQHFTGTVLQRHIALVTAIKEQV